MILPNPPSPRANQDFPLFASHHPCLLAYPLRTIHLYFVLLGGPVTTVDDITASSRGSSTPSIPRAALGSTDDREPGKFDLEYKKSWQGSVSSHPVFPRNVLPLFYPLQYPPQESLWLFFTLGDQSLAPVLTWLLCSLLCVGPAQQHRARPQWLPPRRYISSLFFNCLPKRDSVSNDMGVTVK